MIDQIFALLRAAFGGLGGETIFVVGDNQFQSRDPDAIESFLLGNLQEEVFVNSRSSTNEGRYFAVFCKDEDAIDNALDNYGEPSLALERMDEVCLLFAHPLGEQKDGAGTEADFFPLPGFGGWQLTERSAKILADDPDLEAAVAQADAPEEGSNEPFTLNDAEFIDGDLPASVMDLPITLGFGRNCESKKWPSTSTTFGALVVHQLSKHVVGEKDGTAFLQGSALDNERRANSIDALYIVGLDVDSGIKIEQAIETLHKLNLAGVIYTTHSHLKDTTKVLQSSYQRFAKKNGLANDPTATMMQDFLITERKWEEWIARTIEFEYDPEDGSMTHQDRDGIHYRLRHDPIPKFRIILPLAKPYVIAKQKGMNQKDAIDQWKGRLLGLGQIMNMPIDQSCLDPSRLFYLPRHDKDHAFRIVVTSGMALDFDAVPNLNPRQREQIADDVFSRAGEALGADPSAMLYIDGDFSLKKWVRDTSHTFSMVDMIREVAPDKIRNDDNTDKIEVECPFDDFHSNAGDPEDRACFITNPSPESGSGWFWGCQHNSCKDRDRLQFVKQAADDGWFGRADLSEHRYLCVAEDTPKQYFDIPAEMEKSAVIVRALKKSDPERFNLLRAEVRRLIEAGATKRDFGNLYDAVKDSKLMNSSSLDKVIAQELRDFLAKEEPEKKYQRLKTKYSGLIGSRTPVLVNTQTGYLQQRERIIQHLDLINNIDKCVGIPTFYNYGRVKFRVELLRSTEIIRENGKEKRVPGEPFDVAFDGATKEHLANRLANEEDGIAFLKEFDEEVMSIPIPDNILREILAEESWGCPTLKKFASLPYYNREGKLISKVGYDKESQTFLKPSPILNRLALVNKPTEEQVKAAKELILSDVWGEFPFDDGVREDDIDTHGESSRAHFVAMLLQPFIREMIDGPTPIYLVSKPTAGTGATLLIKTALQVISGKKAEASTQEANEDENRKSITTAFLEGRSYVWVDNVNKELNSAAYCNLATSPVWTDRILGKSASATFENLMMFIMGGNNPRGTYEIMRRCLPIRLDAKSDPRKRSGWKHNPLEEYVDAVQQQIVEALLTLVANWMAQGQPMFTEKTLMSFESWSQITGGILDAAGINGFLGNLHLTQKFADEETASFEHFYNILVGALGLDKPFSTRDIADLFLSGDSEWPSIGVHYSETASVLTPRIARVLNEKLGAPYEVTIDHRHVPVKMMRLKDEKGAARYVIQKMD